MPVKYKGILIIIFGIYTLITYIFTTLEFPIHNFEFHLLQMLPPDWLSYSLSFGETTSSERNRFSNYSKQWQKNQRFA